MNFDFVDQLLDESAAKVTHRPWMDEKKFTLATQDNLSGMIDACIESGRYAIDLETSGLDTRVFNGKTVDTIAGVCLSPDGVHGFYLPIGHVKVSKDGTKSPSPHNIPWRVASEHLKRLVDATEEGQTVATFHNGKFDQEFLQFNGGVTLGEWDRIKVWDDTLILAYLRNSRARKKGLKFLSEEELGIEQVELKELYPDGTPNTEYDFTTLDPTDIGTLWYAGGDAICTWLLYGKLAPSVLEPDTDGQTQRTVYGIEKGCVTATRWMERNRIHISKDKVRELIRLGQQEWYNSIMEVYIEAEKVLGRDVMPGKYKALATFFDPDDPLNLLPAQMERAEAVAAVEFLDPVQKVEGKDKREWPPVYDVNSPQKLGTMFDEMGVPNLKRTEKSGQIKTSKDELKRVIEQAGAQFPFMGLIKRFRETSKALSSYLFPMLLSADPTDDTMQVNFNGHKVDTGRFSTPKDKNRGVLVGWPQINLQSIPATYDPNRPACMTRLRECISARKPNAYIVAVDYAGVELRIVTNLSREPKWMSEFFHCSSCDRTFDTGTPGTTPDPPPERCPNCGSDKIGDLHTLTAISIYGADAQEKPEWPALRGYGKATNFALSYGGGGSAVQRATGVNRNEGWRIKNVFDKTYTGLSSWWGWQHQFGRKHGFVRTALNRRYPVPDITHQEGGFRSKAERNAINGPVQGTSADITKAAMAFVYKECKKRGWLDKVILIVTMHDELVFEIDADVLEEAIHVIVPTMTRNPIILKSNWSIPLTCDVEIGRNWTVPWDLNAMRHREVKFEGNKKIKEPRKPKLKDFDTPEEFHEAAEAYPGKKAAWEAMPHNFPEELRPFFKQQLPGAPLSLAGPPSGSGEPVEVVPSGPMSEEAPQAKQAPSELPDFPGLAQPKMKDVPEGVPFEYRMDSPLTMGLIEKLAVVIYKCQNGTESTLRRLRLVDRDGKVLEVGEFLVNPTKFNILARDGGI